MAESPLVLHCCAQAAPCPLTAPPSSHYEPPRAHHNARVSVGALQELESLSSPRLIHTHLPPSLLPEAVLGFDCRIVYLCRKPKDALVSLVHYFKQVETKLQNYCRSFDEWFCRGEMYSGTIWDHARGLWEKSVKEPERVLFLKYEEMIQEPARVARRLAEFIGFPFSEEEVEVVERLQFCLSLCLIPWTDPNSLAPSQASLRLLSCTAAKTAGGEKASI